MEIIKKIVHILSIIIYIVVILFALIELPIIFGYKPLIVLSGSMEPTYKVGSIVYYHKVSMSELKVGDPITYVLEDGTYITHRIVNIEEDSIETRGDANNTSDPLVSYEQVMGKVAKVNIPVVGYCYEYFLKYHTIIIGILIIILISEFLLTNIKSNNKDDSLEFTAKDVK